MLVTVYSKLEAKGMLAAASLVQLAGGAVPASAVAQMLGVDSLDGLTLSKAQFVAMAKALKQQIGAAKLIALFKMPAEQTYQAPMIEATTEPAAAAAVLFTDGVTCVDVTDNPSQILVGSDDKTLLLYDWSTSSIVHSWRHKRGVKSTRYHVLDSIVISGDRKGNIQVFNRGEAASQTNISAHTMVVSALATSSEHREIVSGSRDTAVCTWDVNTGQNIASSKMERNLVTDVSWVPGTATVLQTSEDLHIRLWDTRTMKITHDVQTEHHFPLCCDVDPTGTYFVLGNNGFSSDGCEAQIWDIRKAATPMCEYKGHTQSVNSCKFVAVGDRLLVATGSKDQTMQIWDATSAELECSCTLPDNLAVSAITCQETNGQIQIMLGNTNGSLQVWDFRLDLEINDRLRLRHATASLGPIC